MCSSIQNLAGYGETINPWSVVLLSQHALFLAPRLKLEREGRPGRRVVVLSARVNEGMSLLDGVEDPQVVAVVAVPARQK